MIGRVTWTDYTVDDALGVLVRISVRMADGSRFNGFVQGTEPYIFAPEDESFPEKEYVEYTERGYESLFDHKLQKIVTNTPKQAGGLTGNFSWTGEADVPYYRRVAIHDGLSGYVDIPYSSEKYEDLPLIDIDNIDVDPEHESDIQPRISIADIEVHIPENDTFDEMTENGSEPINVICSYDTQEKDYSVFYYDKYDNLDTENIRPNMEEQLEGTAIEDYAKSEVGLYAHDSELDMLLSFIDYVNERGFDLISGWNFTDFDYEYIINRIDTLSEDEEIHYTWLSPFNSTGKGRNKQMRICGLPSFDMMEAFTDKMTFGNWRSKSLEYVSNIELGIGKIDDVDINEDWKNNPSKLIAYNIVDVILTVGLDHVNDIHGFFYDIADTSSIPVYDTSFEKRIVDGYIMSRRFNDEVLPTADEAEVPNAGGYVADAANGRLRKIGVSDLKSLYPSAMITWNISTETVAETPENFDDYVKIPHVPEPKKVQGKIEEEQIEWDWLYASLDKEGIIPRTLKKLFRKRNSEKKKMYEADEDSAEEAKYERKQGATKVIMNSFYGNASSPYWRLANEYLGNAITSVSRYTLWKGRKTVERAGYKAVYGDTDSHFIQLTEDTIESQVEELEMISSRMDDDASKIFDDIIESNAGEVLSYHPFLEDSDLHGDKKTCMMWEPEKIYSVWMQLGKKKKYAGNISWKEGTFYTKPKISISGFENQRSDSMEVTAELQKKVIRMILTDASFKEVSEYIRSVIDSIHTNNSDVKKFALPGSLNKPIEEYPNRQIPRASEFSNKHLGYEFGEGDDPFVYFVDETPPECPNTDVVAFEWDDEVSDGFKLDREAIIERGIKKPIDDIINEAGWNFDEIRSGEKTQSHDFGSGNPFA